LDLQWILSIVKDSTNVNSLDLIVRIVQTLNYKF